MSRGGRGWVTPFVVVGLTFARGANAQSAGSPSVQAPFGSLGTITIEMLAESPGTSDLVPMSDATFASWWGMSRCTCQSLAPVGVRISLAQAPTIAGRPVEVWVGSSCSTPNARSADCGSAPVGTFDVAALATGPQDVKLDAARLIGPPNETCVSGVEQFQNVWVLLDTNGDGTNDAIASLSEIPIDTKPPPAPNDVTLDGGKNRIVLKWRYDGVTEATDAVKVQALCTMAADPPSSEAKLPKSFGSITAAYMRVADICSTSNDANVGTSTTGSPIDAPSPSPDYLCGDANASDGQLAIDMTGLNPSLVARVRLVAIDAAGNFTVVKPDPDEAVAVPSADFWQIYKQAGGEGVGCNAAPPIDRSRGAIACAVLLLLGFAILLRRRSLVFGLALVLIAVFASVAFASEKASTSSAAETIDRVHYDEDEEGGEDEDETAVEPPEMPANERPSADAPHSGVTLADGSNPFDEHARRRSADLDASWWSISASIGPYTPEIDKGVFDVPGAVKPYQRVFGGRAWYLPEATISRDLYHRDWGLIGLGISAGWFQKTTSACVPSTDVTNLCANRSPVDETALHIIPIGVLAIYRFPMLVDRRILPIVPHAKLGLAIDPWFITSGDGTTAQKGVTIGMVGAIGLSFRLDSIDSDVAAGMKSELGIVHTSLFVEASRTQAPLFHRSSALDVGATTWCGGLQIEL